MLPQAARLVPPWYPGTHAAPRNHPVTAEKIVDWRTTHGPFRSVDDLDDVPGIGPARIEQLRDLVTP